MTSYEKFLCCLIVALMLVLIVFGICHAQQPPASGQPAAVALTDAEKTEQENIELRAEILSRDQNDLIAKWMQAHHLDPEQYRYNRQMRMFLPNPPKTPPPASPPPAAPAKKK